MDAAFWFPQETMYRSGGQAVRSDPKLSVQICRNIYTHLYFIR